MPETRFDILGIGNAIVDVLVQVDDHFLSRRSMRKGSMTLIDAEAAEQLYGELSKGVETSGGSVANTCVVAAQLGARTAYFGKVADDRLGHTFDRDIAASGVHFPTKPAPVGMPTARCIVLVTPDGQRTMHTFLGAAVAFGPDDLDAAVIAQSAVTYLEGYLFDPPAAQAAFRRAAELAHDAGRQVALSLSDPFCVDRHREDFRDLLQGGVDILFANEAEICSLYEESDLDAAARIAAREVALAVITRSEQGSVIMQNEKRIDVSPEPTTVIDTTGAGDAYAAGFLAAYTAKRPLAQCGRLGSLAAAEVISHIGARPKGDLASRAAALFAS